MASFSLRSQRTGQSKEFSILELLRLLGDPVNDEIWLQDNEDVFNLSSFREIGSGSQTTTENWSMEELSNLSGQDTFYLLYQPYDLKRMTILFNGLAIGSKDYSLNGKELRLPFRLNGQDALVFIYPY